MLYTYITFTSIMTMIQVPFGYAIRFNSDEASAPTETDPLDEWHMDYVPTGYLPDSVYRELAWYGILQVQPLYRSTKHKVAARWVWQNTLGRPHVVMENSQTARTEESLGHQAMVEEAAKWAQEQRLAQEVLMENIRFGGNGLTVRTVISIYKKTVYIIEHGKYFSCEKGSEPDVNAFRTQANIHERKCTNDMEPVPLALAMDPCIDAEHTPLEYSFALGEWMFCLGDGERESAHFPNGTLDCGQKVKMRLSDFLHECAIDNNVVITYEYFGDEPRKDMIHNMTICTSWDPCRIAYLYRIEVPDTPEAPIYTPDPCDTTICPDCLEEITEEQVPMRREKLNKVVRTGYKYTKKASGYLKFHSVPGTYDEARTVCEREAAVLVSPLNVVLRDTIARRVIRAFNQSVTIHTGVEADSSTGAFLSRERVPLSSMPVTALGGKPDGIKNPKRCVTWNTQDHTANYVKCDDVKHPFVCYKKQDPVLVVGCGITDEAYKMDLRTNHCYKHQAISSTWQEAFDRCVSEGAMLATINSETEAMVMKDLFKGHRALESFIYGRNWSKDRKNWLSDGNKTLEETGYSEWGPGEPNNFGGKEDCVVVLRTGKLNDRSCDSKFTSICEKLEEKLFF